MPRFTQGALARKSANQSINNNTLTLVTFPAEDYDVGGWHDTVTNNSRVTVPSGISLVRVYGGIQWQGNGDGDRYGVLLKNGVPAQGCPGQSWAASASINRSRHGFISPPLAVTAGDYFELEGWHNRGSALNIEVDAPTFLGIQELPASTKRAMVKLSANFGVTTGLQYVTWGATEYDTDSFWSAGNPTRLTVPSGVSKVRLYAGARFAAAAISYAFLNIDKNGASFLGGGALEMEAMASGFTTRIAIASAPVEVSPGDYFEVQTRAGASVNLLVDPQTYFAVEVLQ